MLEIKNVVKIFNLTGNEEDKKVALNDLSLTIEDGEFVTIIGGNGSGKSTLMNTLSGVYKPDEGSIILDGVDISKMPEHKRANYFGRVFQDPMVGTAGDMSIIENLEIAYKRGETHSPFKWGFKKHNKPMFVERLKYFGLGLENRLNQKVGLLSGGQRQVLTLLMATIKQPKVLLLDEHTAALDPKTASKVMNATNDIVTSNNMTTLMITHNMADAIKYGTRLIMLNEGKVIFDVKGKEKEQLTVELLLEKFKANQDVVLNDKLILG